jgi:FMN reductase (NADPH)
MRKIYIFSIPTLEDNFPVQLNPTIQTMLNRKSIRRFTSEQPSDKIINTIVQAGQQAPFASQLGSLLLSRKIDKHPFKAPLLFTICVDAHKWELIMERREWQMIADDLMLLVMGMQDAALMAQNMVIAAETFDLGSCFLGAAPFHAQKIIKQFNLPARVFPMVQLAMGYPAEDPQPRPRYPLEFVLFEDQYPDFSEDTIQDAMYQMDQGFLNQNYYQKNQSMIKLTSGRRENYTYDNYSWTEHICRKWGQQFFPNSLIDQLTICGFNITRIMEDKPVDNQDSQPSNIQE